MIKFELPQKETPTQEDLEICKMTAEEYEQKYGHLINLPVTLQLHASFDINKLNDEELQSKLRILLGRHLYMISDEIKNLGLSDNIGLFGIKIGDKVM